MKWKCLDYNHGNHFDGSYFVAPVKGKYFFFVKTWHQSNQTSWIYLNVNDSDYDEASAMRKGSNKFGEIVLQATFELEKNDKVRVQPPKIQYS